MIDKILLITVVMTVVTSYDCTLPGELSFGDYCYKESSISKIWRLAENDCRTLYPGGHLFSITSKEELQFVYTNFSKPAFLTGGNIRNTVDYIWTDGSPFLFSNWASTAHHLNKENPFRQVQLIVDQDVNAWFDVVSHDVNMPYICKWRLDEALSPWDNVWYSALEFPPYGNNGRNDIKCNYTDPSISCPVEISWSCFVARGLGGIGGDIYSVIDGQCFKYITIIQTYDEMSSTCKGWNKNATLATLSTNIQKVSVVRNSANTDGVYIGLNNIGTIKEWYWMGPGHSFFSRSNYTYLIEGGWEAIRTQTHASRSCAYVDLTKLVSISMKDCSQQNGGLCSVRMSLTDPLQHAADANSWQHVEISPGIPYEYYCDYLNVPCPTDDWRYDWWCLNNGHTVYKGRCNIFVDTNVIWMNALASCRSIDKKVFLGELRDDEEQNFIHQAIGDFYIGLNDIYSEGYFKYLDGNELDENYDKTSSKIEDFAKNCFYASSNEWMYDSCITPISYLCQYNICQDSSNNCPDNPWENVIYSTVDNSMYCDYTSNECPSDFPNPKWKKGTWECVNHRGVGIGDDTCVIFVDQTLSWGRAESYCKTNFGNDSHLLSFSESLSLGELVSDIENYLHGKNIPENVRWTGVNRIHSNVDISFNAFEQSNGDDRDFSTLDWDIGEPADILITRCAAFRQVGTGFQLRMFICDDSRRFYCQFPLYHNYDTNPWDNVEYDPGHVIKCDLQNKVCPSKYSTCFDVSYDDIYNVCGGSVSIIPNEIHGTCVSYNNCSCSDGYYPGGVYDDENYQCEFWKCNGKPYYDPQACAEGKLCVEKEFCFCYNDFNRNCSVWQCNGILATNMSHVCSGHGECKFDVNNKNERNHKCHCDDNYYGNDCQVWKCNGKFTNSSNSNVPMCNGHGKCVDNDLCSCEKGYSPVNLMESNNCGLWKCNGVDSTHGLSCSGMGVCADIDVCECSVLVSGNSCNVDGFAIIIISLIVIIPILIIVIVVILIVIIVVLLKRKKKGEELRGIDVDAMKELPEFVSHLKLDPKIFTINEKDVVLKEQIGSGGSNSMIFKATWNGNDVAVKRFQLVFSEKESTMYDVKEVEKELNLMSTCIHPNIIRFFGFSNDTKSISIVMELCKCDLKTYIGDKGKVLSLREKIVFVRDIASVMEFLHNKEIIHRDLKSENILVDNSGAIKLIDFGLSTTVTKSNPVSKTKGIGTPKYMAPEITLGKEYSNKIDVFSFGIMIFEIFSGNFSNPYNVEKSQSYELQFKIANNPSCRPNIKHLKKIPKFLKSLASNCWDHDPSNRFSFKEIVNILKEKYFERKPITIYVKSNDQSDKDAIDYELKDFSIDGLKSIKEKEGVNKLFLKFDKEKSDQNIEVSMDHQVIDFKKDEMLIKT